MILNDNLSASWDGPSQSLVMHGTEPTRLQNIALQLTQKVQQISEANERITQEQAGNKMYSNYRNNNWQGNWQNRNAKGDHKGNAGNRRDNRSNTRGEGVTKMETIKTKAIDKVKIQTTVTTKIITVTIEVKFSSTSKSSVANIIYCCQI